MSKIAALEKRIAELEAEIALLKVRPAQQVFEYHYHYPYTTPTYAPAPWTVPLEPTWLGYSSGGEAMFSLGPNGQITDLAGNVIVATPTRC